MLRNRQLLAEQNNDYMRSLEADQAKERQQEEEQRRKQDEETVLYVTSFPL